MKKLMRKPISIFLCAVLLFGALGATGYALTTDKKETTAQSQKTVTAVQTDSNKKNTKDETVYVLAGADGSVHKIIVSDWIKNTLNSATLNDQTDLSEVENVKGDEAYTMNGKNMRVWDADGNDIYYQGNIEKELPVNLSVTYTLDGKKITPDALAGKSGHLVIRYDYQNNQYETVEIDGKKEKIYVPFVMLTGMLLDTDVCSNINVTNGKLINDGDHAAVIGIALPGLQENLLPALEQTTLPDHVEISADVKNFEMTTTITIATNDLFSQIDTDQLDSVDALTGSLDELKTAMQQLLDGSSQLYGGLTTLLDKSGTLISGIHKLADGAAVLKKGSGALDVGAASLQEGATQLYDGLKTLSENNDTLNGGAKQIFETLLSTADTQIKAAGLTVPSLTIDNYTDVLDQTIASLDDNAVYAAALAQVKAAVEENRPMITEKVTAAVKEQVAAQVRAAVQTQVTEKVYAATRETVAAQVIPVATDGRMTKDSYDAAVAAGAVDSATQAAVNQAIDAQMSTEGVQQAMAETVSAQMDSASVQKTIADNTDAQMKTDAVKNTIAETVELQVKQAIADNMASEAVQEKLQAASEGAKALIALKTSLDSYNDFYLGLRKYTAGVAEAEAGAEKLKAGTDELKAGTENLCAGMNELYSGILQLKNDTPALTSGIGKLQKGAMRLSDGLKEFNRRGVQKLVDLADGDLNSLLTRIRATVDVSKNYKSFTGLSDEMSGQVKFIYRTDSIKTPA